MNAFVFHVKVGHAKYIGYLEASSGSEAKTLIEERFKAFEGPLSIELFGVTSKTFFAKNYENEHPMPPAMSHQEFVDRQMAGVPITEKLYNDLKEGPHFDQGGK